MIIRMVAVVGILATALYFSLNQTDPFSSVTIANQDTQTLVKELPSLELISLEGKKKHISPQPDKFVFIHFWATWCAPCEEEFPTLASFIDKYKDDVDFYLIAVRDEKSKVEKFLKKFDRDKLANIIYFDETSQNERLFGSFKLPETFIFYPDKRIYKRFPGSQNWLRIQLLAPH